MDSFGLTMTGMVASATFILGLMMGHFFTEDFVPRFSGTASQVTFYLKQDREKTIVDLINENP